MDLRKTLSLPVLALGFLAAAGLGWTDEARKAGPQGGRLMAVGKLKVEFHLDKERKARVYLYDAALKPVAAEPGKINLWVVLKDGAEAVKLSKASPKGKDGTAHWVSLAPLPEPGGYPVVLSVKEGPKPVKLRFKLIEEACGECKYPEYACVCGH